MPFCCALKHELEASIHAELLVDVVQVHFHGALRNGQARRDRLVAEPLSDHPDDFDLPRRQGLRRLRARMTRGRGWSGTRA